MVGKAKHIAYHLWGDTCSSIASTFGTVCIRDCFQAYVLLSARLGWHRILVCCHCATLVTAVPNRLYAIVNPFDRWSFAI